MASVKTVDQLNTERRAAKTRQQAVAKSAAKNKTNTVFSIKDAIKDRSQFQHKKAVAQKENERYEADRKANGQALLERTARQGSLMIRRSDYKWNEHVMWENSCYDVINAAKAQNAIWFTWNKDWRESEFLVIGINKS